MLNQQEKNRIIEVLQGRLRKNNRPIICPMCGNNNFTISDAYLNNPLQDTFENIVIGGPAIPTIAIICNNCGFVSQHALGALGLLPQAPAQEGGPNVS